MPRILLIEDHHSTSRTVALYLRAEGFEVDVQANGLDGLAMALQGDYDLLVVDLLLPGLDGRELCRRLRAERSVPLIMLTALSTEDDLVRGLSLGADDYVTKPFSPRELVARIHARLRPGSDKDEGCIRIGNLELNRSQRTLSRDGEAVHLTATEFRLLSVLMQAPGRVYTREQLIERALGYDFQGSSKNIDIHISNLRKRIETDRLRPEYILTVTGHGYRFRPRNGHGNT